MKTITTTKELAEAAEALSRHEVITVDTEFMRESTFWPVLCLIQMAAPGIEALVDPLTDGIDLAPFFKLMADEKVLKVFHAARQDVEIIYHRAGVIPHPIFDTQVAAMVCGYGDSVSYDALVRKTTGGEIDKSHRFTDWSRRPLSDKQLAYALADVTHLRDVHAILAEKLAKNGRAAWMREEMDVLTSPATYDLHPETAWKRLKPKTKKAKQLAVLVEVAAWREEEAQRRDLPRGRIVKDDAIQEIAVHMPTSEEKLGELRTISKGLARSDMGRGLLAAIKRGMERDPRTLPSIERREPLPGWAGATVDLLKVLLKKISDGEGVAQRIIANSEDLQKLACDDEADIPALKGWRRELFGEAALKLKRGELGLAVEGGRVLTFPREPEAPATAKNNAKGGIQSGHRNG